MGGTPGEEEAPGHVSQGGSDPHQLHNSAVQGQRACCRGRGHGTDTLRALLHARGQGDEQDTQKTQRCTTEETPGAPTEADSEAPGQGDLARGAQGGSRKAGRRGGAARGTHRGEEGDGDPSDATLLLLRPRWSHGFHAVEAGERRLVPQREGEQDAAAQLQTRPPRRNETRRRGGLAPVPCLDAQGVAAQLAIVPRLVLRRGALLQAHPRLQGRRQGPRGRLSRPRGGAGAGQAPHPQLQDRHGASSQRREGRQRTIPTQRRCGPPHAGY
mmetsp:Transcript_3182/g.6757  ORF Transcript_3182/g.6757 Transcript_3182/m.6757 type:complete len:271 (+) Transcript_3182:481-1293(+)